MNELIIILLILIIPLCASAYCKSTYNKYRVRNTNANLTGAEVAKKILTKNGLKNVEVVMTSGVMSDHYDPRKKVVRLSSEVFKGTSISSVAIAAHECGHAIQDKEKYLFLKIRSFIFPIVNFSSYIAYFLIIISFILSSFNLFWISIILMGTGVLFQLVTLPVEFNASSRALKQVKSMNIYEKVEQKGIETMLVSAALTYVAGLVSSILEIVRLILMFDRNR